MQNNMKKLLLQQLSFLVNWVFATKKPRAEIRHHEMKENDGKKEFDNWTQVSCSLRVMHLSV